MDWISLLDNSIRSRIYKAIWRMAAGNLADHKLIAPNLYEMRLFFGSGYRIYFTIQNGQIIIILCGGDKKTQTKDIAQAKKYMAIMQGGVYDPQI